MSVSVAPRATHAFPHDGFSSPRCATRKWSMPEPRAKPSMPQPGASESDDIRSLKIQVAALYAQMQTLSSKYEALSSKCDGMGAGVAQGCVEEPTYPELSIDVEEHLVSRITKVVETSILEQGLRLVNKDTLCSKTGIGAIVSPSSELLSPEDEPRQIASLVNDISDQVIARANADPRVCALAESHQSLQDSFSKLLGLLDEDNKPERLNLQEMVIDTRKTCKAIAVEIKQIRQRRNQDVSDTRIRLDHVESKLQIIERHPNDQALGTSTCVEKQYRESGEQKHAIDAAAVIEDLASN